LALLNKHYQQEKQLFQGTGENHSTRSVGEKNDPTTNQIYPGNTALEESKKLERGRTGLYATCENGAFGFLLLSLVLRSWQLRLVLG